MKKNWLYILLSLIISLFLPITAFGNSASPEYGGIETGFLLWVLFVLSMPYIVSIVAETLFAKWFLKAQRFGVIIVTNIFTVLGMAIVFSLSWYINALIVVFTVIIAMLIELLIYWLTYKRDIAFKKIVNYTVLANLISASICSLYIFIM